MTEVSETALQQAALLMLGFAERTGLVGNGPPRRYLWTDAFAVCNFLGLAQATGQSQYTELALRLVDQVHRVLGRHRDDSAISGWLSGLSEADGAAHPTVGGLRIGKKLPERLPNEPFDERLEWERDGQYFHYLTKWMHALDQVAWATRQPLFNLWARELAATAHDCFLRGPAGARSMVWKMSTDLSRPLVPTMGQHDPLDGWLTCAALQTTATTLGSTAQGPDMSGLVREFCSMTNSSSLITSDPLGLGGLFTDAFRVQQLMQRGVAVDGELLLMLLKAGQKGLAHYLERGELRQPAARRLAFRELGLAIGLQAVQRLEPAPGLQHPANIEMRASIKALCVQRTLTEQIQSFWFDPVHRQTTTWLEHQDINDVTLAASLAPEGFLVLQSNC